MNKKNYITHKINKTCHISCEGESLCTVNVQRVKSGLTCFCDFHVTKKITLVWRQKIHTNKIWRKEREFPCMFFQNTTSQAPFFLWNEYWLDETRETKAIWPLYQCLKYIHFGFSLWCLTYLRMIRSFVWNGEGLPAS